MLIEDEWFDMIRLGKIYNEILTEKEMYAWVYLLMKK